MVLCKECKGDTGYDRKIYCVSCISKLLQQNFGNWTSGNDAIDKFIQDVQLNFAKSNTGFLEWIPYDRFDDIVYIAKGGFGKVYKAIWNLDNEKWEIPYQRVEVALKSLNNSKNVTLEFMNEIATHHKVGGGAIIMLYGITQDPDTKNYMMVLQYACNGSFRKCLDNSVHKSLQSGHWYWYLKVIDLRLIADGLIRIHASGLIHRDLHIGNIVHHANCRITDMGLCKPANYNELKNTKKSIYGVLPYVAPEILRGENYTKAADIYSFGIIMYEVFSELPPYHDVDHDNNLAIKICLGLRPRFNIKVPQLIVCLIKRCLDVNPLNRPTADEIRKILCQWINEFHFMNYVKIKTEFIKQYEEAKEHNNRLQTGSEKPFTSLSYETHSGAIYTSRLLNFYNLPKPKNSDDYYDQSDNIISNEFSESLQINISRLNINDEQIDEMD